MFAFTKTSVSLTAKRQSYEEDLMAQLVERIARDLIDNNTTRDVGPVVLARIVKARNPQTKAEEVDSAVEAAIDAAIIDATIKELNSPQEGEEEDTEDQGSSDGALEVLGEDNKEESTLVEETAVPKKTSRKAA